MVFRSFIIISILLAGAVYFDGIDDINAVNWIKIVTIILFAIGLGGLARWIRRK